VHCVHEDRKIEQRAVVCPSRATSTVFQVFACDLTGNTIYQLQWRALNATIPLARSRLCCTIIGHHVHILQHGANPKSMRVGGNKIFAQQKLLMLTSQLLPNNQNFFTPTVTNNFVQNLGIHLLKNDIFEKTRAFGQHIKFLPSC